MSENNEIRVAINGYGVIGRRVADAVPRQEDMALAGVSDVVADWRVRTATTHGFRLFGATGNHADAMPDAPAHTLTTTATYQHGLVEPSILAGSSAMT